MTHQPTDNLRISRTRSLVAPAILAEEIPVSDASAEIVETSRQAIADIVHGKDNRLLVIVGPCSVHDLDAVHEYAAKLKPLADRVADKVFVVMRVYFEKPRTTVGWKGYINDPHLDESFAVNHGLRGARQLLSDITALGLPAATEFLDTTFGQYYSDFVSWGAIGARTVESQVHRQLASGLSMPVGIKNATNGSVEVAIDAVIAASHTHLFPSLTKEGAPALLETTGNPDCHVVLRGGKEPNYDSTSIAAVITALDRRKVDTGIVVDCSHGNSEKNYIMQPEVARSALEQRQSNDRIVGLMLESHLIEGRQDTPEVYGQSITDSCIGWEETERLLLSIAEN